MPVIETTDLTKRYRLKWLKKLTAVDGISVSVERGQVFGFLGPNGSGKTTLIRVLLGIITPPAGEVRLLGRSGRRGLHVARQRVGATLETPNFYPYLTGRQNLKLVANVKRAPPAEIDRVLELVGLDDRQKDLFEKYSLGMKQRLALAATVIGDPELVILDEPTNGLDPEGMREIREVIHRLADRGKTIFLSSHLLWEVEKTCTHVAIIKEGRLVRQASIDEIVRTGVLVEVASADLDALEQAVGDFPGARMAWRDDGRVIVELERDERASLNRWLADRGMDLTHLATHRRSLEDVFIELTGEGTGGGTEEGTDEGSGEGSGEGDAVRGGPTGGVDGSGERRARGRGER